MRRGLCALPRRRVTRSVQSDAAVLALGGGSWPKLGSDASWCRCWQDVRFRSRPCCRRTVASTWAGASISEKFAGHPVKSVAIVVRNDAGAESWHPGEFVITEAGVEGGVIYAVSASLRDEILAKGVATLRLDLAPDRDMPRLTHDLSRPRGKRTVATHLQRQAHIEGVKAGLLREVVSKEDFVDPARSGRFN